MESFPLNSISKLSVAVVLIMMGITSYGILSKLPAIVDQADSIQNLPVFSPNNQPDGLEISAVLSETHPLPSPKTLSIHSTSIPVTQPMRVLIYHTHTYEAYLPDENAPYPISGGNNRRTQDETQNIVAVGARLAERLREYGIEVVHDTTEFEPPKFGTAYLRSLDMLQHRLQSGETYDLIIDLHRDTYYAQRWTPAFVQVDQEDVSRILFLIGNGEAGFSEKPNWSENKKRAEAIAELLTQINPQLCADIVVNDQRYNQHVSENAILIEMGHCENTLESVLRSADYLALAISEMLKGN